MGPMGKQQTDKLTMNNSNFSQIEVWELVSIVTSLRLSDAYYTYQSTRTLLAQVMVCCLLDAEPLSELIPTLLIGTLESNLGEIQIKSVTKMHFKMTSAKWQPFWLCFNILTLCDIVTVTPYGEINPTWVMPFCLMAPCHYQSSITKH